MEQTVEASVTDNQAFFTFFNEIGIINQLASARAERAMPHGMTMPQFSVLNHFVRGRPPASPLKLANAFQVTKGAMTHTVRLLEEKGYVSVTPHETDGRSKIVFITQAGRAAHRDAQLRLLDYFSDFAQAFRTEDVADLLPKLEAIRVWLDDNRR